MDLIVKEAGKARIIVLKGPLVLGRAEIALRETVESLVREGNPRIVINMDGVSCLDSTAIGELVASRMAAEAAGGAVFLVLPESRITELKSVDFPVDFPSFRSELEAVGSF